jgi:uncharacterized protein
LKLTRQSSADRQTLQRYGNGGFRVSGADFQGSIIVTLSHTFAWPVTAMGELTIADFQPLIAIAATLDVCLLGCGPEMLPLPREIRTELKEAGLMVDPMDTGAACRTYNVLMGEGRAVAAALIAI